MKFICEKKEFVSGLNIAMRAVPAKSSMPILECIRIGACDGVVALMSNDMEFCIHTTLAAMVMENGSVCLDAKLLNEIIRKLPDGDVTLETDENLTTKISCGKAKFHISGREPDEFPNLPDVKGGTDFRISQPVFREMIQKTIFCAAQNENNRLMTGLYLEVDEDKLKAVALDGHRIAIKERQLDASYGTAKAVIPAHSLSEISKILNGGINDKLHINLSQNHAVFQMDGTVMCVRLIDGEYFNYDRAFSHEVTTKVFVDRQEILDCVSRCAVVIRDGDKKPLILDIHDNSVNVSARTTVGTVSEDIEIEKEGYNLRIGFNARFFLDAIAAVDDDEIEIRLANNKAPAFVTKDDDDYVYVILPVNTGE